MIKISTAIMILLTIPAAGAVANLETAFATRLGRTHHAAEVAKIRLVYDRARVSRLRCDLQHRRGIAPLACYELLDLERAWGIRDPAAWRRRRQRLDVSCRRAADRLRVPEDAEIPAAVSDPCRRRVREAIDTNRYRGGDWSTD